MLKFDKFKISVAHTSVNFKHNAITERTPSLEHKINATKNSETNASDVILICTLHFGDNGITAGGEKYRK